MKKDQAPMEIVAGADELMPTGALLDAVREAARETDLVVRCGAARPGDHRNRPCRNILVLVERGTAGTTVIVRVRRPARNDLKIQLASLTGQRVPARLAGLAWLLEDTPDPLDLECARCNTTSSLERATLLDAVEKAVRGRRMVTLLHTA